MNSRIIRWAIVLSTGGMLIACSKPDPTIILGKWKADSFANESLKIPIAPNIEVTRNQLILRTPDGTSIQSLALSAIRAEKDSIELEVKDALGISLIFTVESPSRIHFKVPFVGADITYFKQ